MNQLVSIYANWIIMGQENKDKTDKLVIDTGFEGATISLRANNINQIINNPGGNVETTMTFGHDGEIKNLSTRIEGKKESTGKRQRTMSLRDMLIENRLDKAPIKEEILEYTSRIRGKFVKPEMDKLYLKLWANIVENEAFAIDLFDPGSMKCSFNRYLVTNIIHYLSIKGFLIGDYNQSALARCLEKDGDDKAQDRLRKGLRFYPEDKYCKVIDEILKELSE